jgi:hypothetical protein
MIELVNPLIQSRDHWEARMTNHTRWRFVPDTRPKAVLSLVAGLLLLVSAVWRLEDGARVPALSIISAVLAVALVALAIAGLVAPRLRGR